MLKPCPSRAYYLSQAVAIAGLLAFAYYLEFFQGLAPCALCEVQRLLFMALGGMLIMGGLLPQRRLLHLICNGLLVLIAGAGVIFAGRQVWLQYFPAEGASGTCEASLHYLLQILPWQDALLNVFIGGPECAKINWQWMHLSIAAWSLLWFCGFLVLALWQGLGWWCSKR